MYCISRESRAAQRVTTSLAPYLLRRGDDDVVRGQQLRQRRVVRRLVVVQRAIMRALVHVARVEYLTLRRVRARAQRRERHAFPGQLRADAVLQRRRVPRRLFRLGRLALPLAFHSLRLRLGVLPRASSVRLRVYAPSFRLFPVSILRGGERVVLLGEVGGRGDFLEASLFPRAFRVFHLFPRRRRRRALAARVRLLRRPDAVRPGRRAHRGGPPRAAASSAAGRERPRLIQERLMRRPKMS